MLRIRKTKYMRKLWETTGGDERSIMFALYMDYTEYMNEDVRALMMSTGDMPLTKESFHKVAQAIIKKMSNPTRKKS